MREIYLLFDGMVYEGRRAEEVKLQVLCDRYQN